MLAEIAELYGPSLLLWICTSHQSEQIQQTQNLNNSAIYFFECVLPLFSPAQTSTDPKQLTIKNTGSLLQIKICSNIKCITNLSNMALKTFWVHLSEKFCSLSSHWRISASRQAHLRFWHFCYDLSNPKTQIQPDCTAHASKPAFCHLHQPQFTLPQAWVFCFDRRMDQCSQCLPKEGDLLFNAHPGHTSMCKCLDHGWMFAAICAILVPSFRMFGHLFMDAEPACDPSVEERILWTRNFTCTCKDALASLVPSKYCGHVCLACFHVNTIVLVQHSRGESHVLEKSYTCHPRFTTHFACHDVLVSLGWKILTNSGHSTRFRCFS